MVSLEGLFFPLEPGYRLLGEYGGKVLSHGIGSKIKTPKRYHLFIAPEDDSFLTPTTQMWGAMLYEEGAEREA